MHCKWLCPVRVSINVIIFVGVLWVNNLCIAVYVTEFFIDICCNIPLVVGLHKCTVCKIFVIEFKFKFFGWLADVRSCWVPLHLIELNDAVTIGVALFSIKFVFLSVVIYTSPLVFIEIWTNVGRGWCIDFREVIRE